MSFVSPPSVTRCSNRKLSVNCSSGSMSGRSTSPISRSSSRSPVLAVGLVDEPRRNRRSADDLVDLGGARRREIVGRALALHRQELGLLEEALVEIGAQRGDHPDAAGRHELRQELGEARRARRRSPRPRTARRADRRRSEGRPGPAGRSRSSVLVLLADAVERLDDRLGAALVGMARAAWRARPASRSRSRPSPAAPPAGIRPRSRSRNRTAARRARQRVRPRCSPGRITATRQISTAGTTPGAVSRGDEAGQGERGLARSARADQKQEGRSALAAASFSASTALVMSRERPKNTGACLAPNAARPRNGEPLVSIGHSTERPLRTFSSSQVRSSFSISPSNWSVLWNLWKASLNLPSWVWNQVMKKVLSRFHCSLTSGWWPRRRA